jgi:K+-sensing histidine kinase KdpD
MTYDKGYLLPMEREVAERVLWLIRLRWIFAAAGAGIAVLAGPVLGFSFSLAPVLATIAVAAALNYAFLLAARNLPDATEPGSLSAARRFAVLQVGTDWAVIFALALATGGALSPVAGAVLFHVVIGSLVLSRKGSYALVGVAMCHYAALAAFTYLGWVSCALWPSSVYSMFCKPDVLAGGVVLFGMAVGVTALLGTTVAGAMREREHDLMLLERTLGDAFGRSDGLADFARDTSATLDLQEVLRLLAERVVESTYASACVVRLIDDNARLPITAVVGVQPDHLDCMCEDVSSSTFAREVLSGRSMAVLDAQSDERVPNAAFAREAGLASLLGVPIEYAGERLGLLCAFTPEPHVFTEEEVVHVRTLADTCSLAVVNARTYGQLEQIDKDRSRFVRTVSHELRAPISVVESILNLFDEGYAGELTERQRDLIERARKRTSLLMQLVNDLLDYAAGDISAIRRADLSRLDIRDAVRSVISAEQGRAVDIGVELREHISDEPLFVSTDETLIERALVNVVDNALKYTPSGGSVDVAVSSSGSNAVVVVRDTGIGIPQSALKRIGTEFYRAPNAKQHSPSGTGLGAAIVRRIVEEHTGTVAYESEEGKGTTVTIRLPLTDADSG